MTSSDTQPQPQPEHHEHIHPTVRGGVALWTLLIGFAMLMVGNGLNAAVLGVRTVDEGFGVRTTGVVMACYFAGFLLGPPAVLRMLSAVGHIRVFASLASIGSCAVLVHFVWISPLSWGAMRVVFGFCMAGLFVVVESWLNDASTPSSRGRTLAVYGIVSMGGLAMGQLLIATGEADGPTLFAVASILVSMSFVPMALAAATDAPPVRVAERLGIRELLGVAPTGVIGMLLTGASHGIVLGLGAVYATGAGFGATRTAVFVAAPAIGAPAAAVADRFGVRPGATARGDLRRVGRCGDDGVCAGDGRRRQRVGHPADAGARRVHVPAVLTVAVPHARLGATRHGDGCE